MADDAVIAGATASATRLYALLDSLRACLCTSLALEDSACFCGLLPRASVAADCTCKARDACGQAWVRLDRLYPSKAFPTPDNTPNNCGSILAAVIELGVNRCLPVIDSQGRAPSAAAQANAVQQQVRDSLAIWAAVSCCTELTARPYVLGQYQPRDGGDCGGGVWPVTVHLVRAA